MNWAEGLGYSRPLSFGRELGIWRIFTRRLCRRPPPLRHESVPQFWARIPLPPFLGKASSLRKPLALLPSRYCPAPTDKEEPLWLIPPSLSTSQARLFQLSINFEPLPQQRGSAAALDSPVRAQENVLVGSQLKRPRRPQETIFFDRS